MDALFELCRIASGEIWSKNSIVDFITARCCVNPQNIRLSPYCYNRIMADGREYDDWPKLLEVLPNGEFKIYGYGYPYTGPIYYREENCRGFLQVGICSEGIPSFDEDMLRCYGML